MEPIQSSVARMVSKRCPCALLLQRAVDALHHSVLRRAVQCIELPMHRSAPLRRHGDTGLEMLKQVYGHNPHFIIGTTKAHPQIFVVVGIQRTGLAPSDLER